MKILFLAEYFPGGKNPQFTGGVEAYNYYLANELSKKHEVIVLCRNQGQASGHPEQPNRHPELVSGSKPGLKIIRAGIPQKRIDTSVLTVPFRLIFAIDAIRKGLKEDFDLVQGNNFVTFIPAFIIGAIKNKPTVAWYADVFVGNWIRLTGLLSGIIGEFAERLSLILRWGHIVALSNSTKEKLVRNGVPRNRITTIYAGVDSKIYNTHHVIASAAKQSKSPFKIICISRLVNYKRVDCLILASYLLKEKGLNFEVNIVGHGPLKNEYLNLIKDLKLQERVKIFSNLPQDELVVKLKSSHLLVHPSKEEGFGLVVIEAAACGVPSVLSDIPVLKEITKNGKGGALYFDKDSPDDLAEKIESLMSPVIARSNATKQSNHFYEKLSADAYNLSKEYTWDQISAQFSSVYEKVSSKT